MSSLQSKTSKRRQNRWKNQTRNSQRKFNQWIQFILNLSANFDQESNLLFMFERCLIAFEEIILELKTMSLMRCWEIHSS